jgi:hypothetical protein
MPARRVGLRPRRGETFVEHHAANARVHGYAESALGRVLGIVAIALGTAVVGFNPERFDTVLFAVPIRTDHGVHLHDVIGVALVALGALLLWFLPRPASRPSQ